MNSLCVHFPVVPFFGFFLDARCLLINESFSLIASGGVLGSSLLGGV